MPAADRKQHLQKQLGREGTSFEPATWAEVLRQRWAIDARQFGY